MEFECEDPLSYEPQQKADNSKINPKSVFVIVLVIILVYFIYSHYSSPIIFKDEDNEQGTAIIYLPNQTIDTLNKKYNSEYDEFGYCLYGNYQNGVYLITKIEERHYANRSREHIAAEVCPDSNLGELHSHPESTSCELSEGDINTLLNGSSFTVAVMCGANRFAFFTKEQYLNSMKVYSVTLDDNGKLFSRTDITLSDLCPLGTTGCNGKCYTTYTEEGRFVCELGGIYVSD